MLNALDITKFVTHAYNAIIDVMGKKMGTTRIFLENISGTSIAL